MSEKIFTKFQQVILISAAVIMCAQIHFNLFNSNFKVSIGIIVFSLSLILFGKYPVLPVTFLSASGVLLSRVLLAWFRYGQVDFIVYVPEIAFYLVYGILFSLYSAKENYILSPNCIFDLFFFDYVSNLIELMLRSSIDNITINMQISIILVALFRAAIIAFIMGCLHYYKFSLLRLEHAQRYQRLLLLISRLNDDVVLMKKNTQMIENTMNTSYKLFHEMESMNVAPELSKKALSVAKDVHELKKEYMLILRGLSDAMELNLKDEGMYLNDILLILKNSLSKSVPDEKSLSFHIELDENIYTQKHYFLMSVLRNLFNNAIEASHTDSIEIKFSLAAVNQEYILTIEDNGPGIDPENLEEIFQPGFSTKINYETGEINRGLGLNLVKDIITNQFNGTISVESVPGSTIFTINIPKNSLEGDIL